MKVYIHREDIPPYFVLQHKKKRLLVAHSVYRERGSLWLSREILWKMNGRLLYEKSSHLHFLIVFGYTPEQVWEEAEKYQTATWIL